MSSLRKVLTYLTVAAAALLGAVNYELFVFPNQFAPSGLNGICTMVQHITGFSVGYLSLIINVPLAVLVYCKVSKPIALRSMVYVVTFSLGLLILDHVNLSAFAYSTDNGTSTILGPLAAGIIMGFIMSILSKAGAYSGGTDFVAALIHVKHPQQSVYGLIFTINTIVAVGSYFVYDFQMEPVILCIIYCFASSTVVERAMRSGREAICFEIITDYPQEISRQIISHLGHTTTLIPARGMYSGEEKNMLICVVNKVQASALNQIIEHYPKTFGVVYPVIGPDYRFTTTLAYDGDIEEGVLHGNIYIIGGADPTLGSRDSIATPAETLFRQWEKMVRDAGISTVDGSIIGDGRYFEGAMEEVTWLWEDIGTYYGAGTCGLTFYENMISFSAAPGREIGDEVDMKPEYPETPWMEIRYKGTTAKAGTGDQLYMYTSELAPVAEIRGTLAMDKGRKRVDCSNKFPELTCATYFMRHLEKTGIRCLRGAGDFKLETGWMSRGEENRQSDTTCNEPVRIMVGQTQSPILQSIAFETNHESNNVYAETLLRAMGVEFGGSSLYPQSISILEQILGNGVPGCQGEENSFEIEGLGIDMSKGIFIKDGSGLSRGNLVSPDFFCRFLAAMSKSPAFNGWLTGLPSPGGNGTLSYNMKKYPESVRKRIRMKSGSMNGVRCYSGYILPEGYIAEEGGCTTGEGGCITEEGGRTSKEGGCTTNEGGSPTGEGKGRNEDIIVFSVMVNNCTSPNWKVRPLIDKIIATIAME